MRISVRTSLRRVDEGNGEIRGLRTGLGLMVAAVAAAALLPAVVEAAAVWRMADMPVIRLLVRLIEGVI